MQDDRWDVYSKKFGKNLASVRDIKGFTQEKLAFESGMDRTYISLIERGLRTPTIKRLWHIARALGVPLTRLVDC